MKKKSTLSSRAIERLSEIIEAKESRFSQRQYTALAWGIGYTESRLAFLIEKNYIKPIAENQYEVTDVGWKEVCVQKILDLEKKLILAEADMLFARAKHQEISERLANARRKAAE